VAIRTKRQDRDDLRGRSPKQARELREQAAQLTAVCADCFAPLTATASTSWLRSEAPASPITRRATTRASCGCRFASCVSWWPYSEVRSPSRTGDRARWLPHHRPQGRRPCTALQSHRSAGPWRRPESF
jgi:hypothetical protein